jgi:hypothetical protein
MSKFDNTCDICKKSLNYKDNHINKEEYKRISLIFETGSDYDHWEKGDYLESMCDTCYEQVNTLIKKLKDHYHITFL